MSIRQIPINTLEEGVYCDSVYMVKRRQLATAKTGKAYMNLTLMDKTGEVTARIFNNVETYAQAFSEGDIVYVQARVQIYDGKMQLVIDALERVSASEVNPEDFLPAGDHDPDILLGHLRHILETIEDENIRTLCLAAVFDEPYLSKWRRAPAAQSMHHPFLGGLLEHTLSVLILLDTVGRHYKNVSRDLLLAGGLFHDIGKIYELEYGTNIGYTDRGRLIPHLVIGVQILDRLSEKIEGFPTDTKLLLGHIILAHHGSREFGSPVIPATVEALIVHYIDDMDAKVWTYLHEVEKTQRNTDWSDRHFLLGTMIRRTTQAKGPLYGYNFPEQAHKEQEPKEQAPKEQETQPPLFSGLESQGAASKPKKTQKTRKPSSRQIKLLDD